MRIESSNLEMASARKARTVSGHTRKISAGGISEKKEAENKSPGETLSDYLGTMRERIEEIKAGKTGYNAYSEEGKEELKKLREECITWLIRLFFPARYEHWWNKQKEMSGESFAPFGMGNGKETVFSIVDEYSYEESEETSFSATGTVKTADGRSLDFNMNLYMSRNFQAYCREEIGMVSVNLCDPLVINLDGNIPELSDQTFCFDIDCDGEEDEISRMAGNSGFLALDLNGDGTVNDGSELFGTKSGNGFEDLRAFDEDGNGFIDEGDEIFGKLRIWAVDAEGKMQLYSLQEKGVGAIGLQHASTQFSLNSLQDNRTNGLIRNTGMFFFENGNVGTMQQVDLAKHVSGYKEREAIASYI